MRAFSDPNLGTLMFVFGPKDDRELLIKCAEAILNIYHEEEYDVEAVRQVIQSHLDLVRTLQ